MPSKLKSRKFWMAMIVNIAGIATAIWGVSVGAQVETIAGAALLIVSTLGYITAEAAVDVARAKSNQTFADNTPALESKKK